jgi:lysophospholipase L1-like esterase
MPMSTLSITVAGDRIPDLELAPERRDEGGSGWVRRLGHLLALHLSGAVALTDATEPGTTVHKLRERWCDDVLLPQPDIVLLHTGLSDAWGSCDRNNAYAKEPAATIAVLEDLLARTRERSPRTRVILVEPCLSSIDGSPQRNGPVRAALAPYAAALRALATRLGLDWLPAGSLIAEAKQLRQDDEWLGWEATGLDTCGSMLLADAALRLVAGLPPAQPTVLAAGQTLLLVGDSITDAGRRGPARPMGVGYARLLQGLQAAREPAKPVRFINKGIGGDTIVDIESRWGRDALRQQPDWLLLYTGINDLNSTYGRRVAVTPEHYHAGLRRCLEAARNANPQLGLVVAAPFLLSRDDHPESYRHEVLQRLPGYIGAAAEVARSLDARFVDLQAAMRPLMDRFGNRALGSNLGADTVHPSELGCLAIAEAMYAGLRA